MDRFRATLLLTGLAGVLLGGVLAAGATGLLVGGSLKPPLSYRLVTWLLAGIMGAFSLAEIPVMIFALRRLLIERRDNRAAVLGLNGLYVFFPVVYGLPVLLLTGSLGWGLGLCSLSLVRLASSLILLQPPEA